MKRLLIVLTLLLFVCGYEEDLLKPDINEDDRKEFGVDKNINEKTIDKYLSRKDSVYIDMRMLKDPGNYENIGGDSYLSGFIKGFEVIPYPLIVNVTNLPDEVGNSYTGKTLFTVTNNEYKENYKESKEFLEYFFPKDKYIFLMCGAGGYAGMMKNMLISLGWDKFKIYNIGGYWYYNGNNKVIVKNNDKYDFWKVTYHDINFNELEEIN